MKFSIRDLFLVTVIAALTLGWAIDHWRSAIENQKDAVRNTEKIGTLEQRVREAESRAEEVLRILNHTALESEKSDLSNSSVPVPNPPNP
ncbi:MAG: hypothetical protein K8R36_04990 [Planctomycetales bacterium]|nr:hypothetical protein [Planctomycetales bacterium]